MLMLPECNFSMQVGRNASLRSFNLEITNCVVGTYLCTRSIIVSEAKRRAQQQLRVAEIRFNVNAPFAKCPDLCPLHLTADLHYRPGFFSLHELNDLLAHLVLRHLLTLYSSETQKHLARIIMKTPRRVPWTCQSELTELYDMLFSPAANLESRRRGLARVGV